MYCASRVIPRCVAFTRIPTSNRFPNSEHDDAADRAKRSRGTTSGRMEHYKGPGAGGVERLRHGRKGMVIAGADTGVQWDHPALKSHYRGWDGSLVSHDYNWHDAIHSGSAILADTILPFRVTIMVTAPIRWASSLAMTGVRIRSAWLLGQSGLGVAT